jgi:hypothetical protein
MNPLIQFKKICLVCVAVLACYGLSPALNANGIAVTNTNDSGPGSLRAALAVPNDGERIDASRVSGTILLTSGELKVTHSVSILGPGGFFGNLTIDGNFRSRVFENFASNVTISGFTITNGRVADDSGGGGILNHGGLTVSDCIVSNSQCPFVSHFTEFGGGGIFNVPGAALTVIRSTISGNYTDGYGGGIYTLNANLTVVNSIISDNGAGTIELGSSGFGGGIAYEGGTVTITNSVISRNSARYGGGGMAGSSATVNVKDSTIGGNSAGGSAGAIDNLGTLTVTNSTISANHSSGGGSISHGGGKLTVTNSTISFNGALHVQSSSNFTVTNSTFTNSSIENSGNFTVANSTFINSSIENSGSTRISDTVLSVGGGGTTIFNDVGGTVTSFGYNLASDAGGGFLTGPGDQINTDPMLGPLKHNGGPTFTHALLPGSPAINAGNPNFTAPPVFDQRGPGYPRVVNGRIDIGSFEVQ